MTFPSDAEANAFIEKVMHAGKCATVVEAKQFCEALRQVVPLPWRGPIANMYFDAMGMIEDDVKATRLANAKARAVEIGQAPFDIDELAQYIDLTWRAEASGIEVPLEEKIAHWEWMYYCGASRSKNMQEFAEHIKLMRLWDFE